MRSAPVKAMLPTRKMYSRFFNMSVRKPAFGQTTQLLRHHCKRERAQSQHILAYHCRM
jgi:hypothetical protein